VLGLFAVVELSQFTFRYASAINIFPFNVPISRFEMSPAMNGPVGAKLKVLIARWLLSLKWMPTVRVTQENDAGRNLFLASSDAEPTCERPVTARAR
jgi:hypothetical protein